MVELIWDFRDFMEREFASLSMGLTPSGHLHLGFLTTLACALMYLKEHPISYLVVTNVENSLSTKLGKYHGYPLRFQYLEDGNLIIPIDYKAWEKRKSVCTHIQSELVSLVWQLIHIFDAHTGDEAKAVKKSILPARYKKFLKLKENKVFHLFGTHIYIYSFLSILEHDAAFRNKMIRFLTDPEFAKLVGPVCGLKGGVFNFGNKIFYRGKTYRPKYFQVPIRIYCPTCLRVCTDWAKVVTGHPLLGKPTLVAECKNYWGCPRARKEKGSDGFVYHKIPDALDQAEFHFMLDPMRDFFHPFKADCHIYGGDYFLLHYEHSGQTAVDRLHPMFQYLEDKTGQSKCIFGGPLVTVESHKMSKSGKNFNIRDLKRIKPVFLNIVKYLETVRARNYPRPLRIEYTELLKRIA
jgi:hypothetical protein